MRDIRDDLRARRAAVMGRYGDAMHHFDVELERLNAERRTAIETFEAEKMTLDAMIVLEERRQAAASNEPAASSVSMSITLCDYLVTKIQSEGPIDKDRLRLSATADGFTESGRAFNMTLQNIANGGRVSKLPDGRFSRADAPRTCLFGLGSSSGGAPMTAQ